MIFSLALIAIFILAYCFTRYFWNWRVEPWPAQHFKLPLNQVHRGYWREGIQENTLEAFREAKRRGANMVELDVQLSNDGIVVVFHDDDTSRFSDQNKRVSDLTARELKEIVNAPTLYEVLSDPDGPQYFNIEIKSEKLKSNGLEISVAKTIINKERIIFSSFNPFVLRRMYRLMPDVPRALLVTNEKNEELGRFYLRQMLLGGFAKANMVNLYHKMLTPHLKQRLDERKIPVAVWTVNDEILANLMLKNHGVVSIISDKFPIG